MAGLDAPRAHLRQLLIADRDRMTAIAASPDTSVGPAGHAYHQDVVIWAGEYADLLDDMLLHLYSLDKDTDTDGESAMERHDDLLGRVAR